MWIAKEVVSKETSWRENFGFLESSAECTVNGNGEKKSSELKDSGSSGARYIETANNCDDMHDSLGFFTIREQNAQAATVTMTVEGKELVLEVDTGASVTVILNKMFKGKLGHLKLRPVST